MEQVYGYIYGLCYEKLYKINIIVSSTTFDVNAVNLIPGIFFFQDDPCVAPVIANAALYWTDSILCERDSLRG